MKFISGEIIAHQLADKLCELNGWASRSGQHNIAEIRFRECIERGIAAEKITAYCPVTFTKLSLENRLFEDATFSEQEVMDYLNSELPRSNEWHGSPDWLHWVKVGYVDAWQGTALAHNLDPVTYTEPINTNQRAVFTSILPPDIHGKYKAARQHFGDRELMPLREFAAWAQSEGWAIPYLLGQFTGIVTRTPAPLFGYGFSEEAQKITTLTKYLELETWTPIEAAMLVCGLQPPQDCHEIPQGAMGLDNAWVMPNADKFHHAKRVLQLWNSRENPPDKIRPADFVAWCNSKGINTDWLRDIEAAAPQTETVQDGKSRRDKQIAAILKHGKSLGYNMKLVPYGGKAKIESLCLKEPAQFTKDSFKNAWQEARNRDLLDVEGVDKYRKPA
ncbi:MAG: hypothetical protein ACYCZJ_02845 [Sulfuriferula sp.]